MTTSDRCFPSKDLDDLLNNALEAIATDDHRQLFKTIHQVAVGVVNEKDLSDPFYNNRVVSKAGIVVPLSTRTNS